MGETCFKIPRRFQICFQNRGTYGMEARGNVYLNYDSQEREKLPVNGKYIMLVYVFLLHVRVI